MSDLPVRLARGVCVPSRAHTCARVRCGSGRAYRPGGRGGPAPLRPRQAPALRTFSVCGMGGTVPAEEKEGRTAAGKVTACAPRPAALARSRNGGCRGSCQGCGGRLLRPHLPPSSSGTNTEAVRGEFLRRVLSVPSLLPSPSSRIQPLMSWTPRPLSSPRSPLFPDLPSAHAKHTVIAHVKGKNRPPTHALFITFPS